MNEQRKGRAMLLFMIGVFVFPVVVGLVLYLVDWRPGGKSHGELLRPVHLLNAPPMQTAQKKRFDAADWRGKWHLVMVAPGSCEADCLRNLAMMRQVHASLGKEIDRLGRVWIQDGASSPEVLQVVQEKYQDLVILPKAATLAQEFGAAGTGKGVFLVDPLGNIFMHYPHGADPNGIRKDLMRLLAYSWTG